MKKTVCHTSTGTVSYWSVYQAYYIEHAVFVPDCELAAMSEHERVRVINHLEKFKDR